MQQALTANRLRDGRVVFLAPGGRWSPDLADARLAHDPDTAADLAAAGARAEAAGRVIGACLIEIASGPAGRHPVALRELMRVTGPTVGPARH